MNVEKILIFGLGKLGLPLCTVFSQQVKVIGVDIDENKINKLKTNELPFFEPDLNKYFINGKNNLNFFNFEDYNIDDIDIAIILVNTPSEINGEFSNKYIYDVLDSISSKLKTCNKSDFLIILSSTVMPGSCEEFIKYLENNSNKKINEDFGFAYIPDLVALGSVIKDFENPDLLILGESEKKYGDESERLYKKIIKNNSPIVRMSLVDGELTKVSLNAYITMKISFANFLGNICEKIGANSNNITKALGYDKRISPYYIKSGLPFGGTCFPRDTWAFIKMSEKLDLDAIHIKSTQKINENQHQILFEKLKKYNNKKIGIFGISFKPNTSVITESAGYILYEKLKKLRYNVFACDEIVDVDYNFNNIEEFINNSDVVVLMHDSKILKKYRDIISKKILINPWNINF